METIRIDLQWVFVKRLPTAKVQIAEPKMELPPLFPNLDLTLRGSSCPIGSRLKSLTLYKY